MTRKVFIKICALVLFCTLVVKCGYEYFVVASCYDLGGVFDEKNNQCRTDCLMISKVNGCIQLTKEQVDLLKSGKGFSKEEMQDICLKNNLPFRSSDGLCDFDFDKSNLDF